MPIIPLIRLLTTLSIITLPTAPQTTVHPIQMLLQMPPIIPPITLLPLPLPATIIQLN